mmetsp:Transcript_11223/g.23257  ORF Transcript_11223/g.23257 Transcript_11223/m.23257 type:complete len:244 (-) Transcript_11223:193-924(-)
MPRCVGVATKDVSLGGSHHHESFLAGSNDPQTPVKGITVSSETIQTPPPTVGNRLGQDAFGNLVHLGLTQNVGTRIVAVNFRHTNGSYCIFDTVIVIIVVNVVASFLFLDLRRGSNANPVNITQGQHSRGALSALGNSRVSKRVAWTHFAFRAPIRDQIHRPRRRTRRRIRQGSIGIHQSHYAIACGIALAVPRRGGFSFGIKSGALRLTNLLQLFFRFRLQVLAPAFLLLFVKPGQHFQRLL